jgi:lysophospholipase L1-like esterase
MSFHRYVAIGDSFTEGVGDADPTRPNGLRGWADRVAEVLAAQTDDFGYANLAIRGRKLDKIVSEQLQTAIDLKPDLVTIYAGANDILRPAVDLDALVATYDEALGKLVDTGAKVVVWTAFDTGGAKVFAALRARFALYNELVREVADRRGLTVVDFWRFREYREWRMWDADRIHMAPAGHQQMAIRVLDALGIVHDLEPLPLGDPGTTHRKAQIRGQALWLRDHAVPWVQRRLTGKSSGDGIEPKRPTLLPIEPAPTHVG